METLLEKNKLFRFNINLRKLKKNSALKKKRKKCILEDRKIEKSKLVERQGRKAYRACSRRMAASCQCNIRLYIYDLRQALACLFNNIGNIVQRTYFRMFHRLLYSLLQSLTCLSLSVSLEPAKAGAKGQRAYLAKRRLAFGMWKWGILKP